MSILTTLLGADTITSSRTAINTNFSNLNADKIETSTLDTDTALAANSDLKIPSQKAVKAYVDGVGVANATTTVKGTVEVATQAEVDAGTATGATGASLVVTPATLAGSAPPQVVTFTSSGTWTKDAGLKYIVVEVQGAGAGGGGEAGTGGGAGGYAKKLILASALGATEDVTIATAGAGATATNGADASGATTFVVTSGVNVVGNRGLGVRTGGTATGGDVNITGQAGANEGSGSGGISNGGGNSILGFGGADSGGNTSSSSGGAGGNAASGYGGGGGAARPGSDGTFTGGAGTPGIVIVTEYYS